ncbi:hypothetical protein DEU56DRAFT_296820 [Suillus clintonianus]|uniref:uncharacterized protein n=1 Tax=Suillus clintonianus TaxID=1904413 RepID=UPI001B87D39F|nr:uncharacterized protein DEU56DRAFT_296820 [Suillus clintonianus]KAG2140174.1 hypothetical protein DEU56DRAFT_296820 [Suillus clintonianus]
MEKKNSLPSSSYNLFIMPSRILQIAPNATLRLVPRSPDRCDRDTRQITDKHTPQPQDTSSLNTVLPPRLKRLAERPKHSSTSGSSGFDSGLPPRLERLSKPQKHSSTSTSGSSDPDSGLPTRLKRLAKRKHSSSPERSTTDKSRVELDKPRLFIRIPPSKRPIPVTKDDKSDDSHAQDNEETRSLTEISGAKSDAASLFIKIPPRQTVTATNENCDDTSLQEEEEESSYSESSDDESDEEYLPPRKRQRRCLEGIANLPTSRARSRPRRNHLL